MSDHFTRRDGALYAEEVPLADIADFVAAKRKAGTMMDVKLLTLLGAGILAGA